MASQIAQWHAEHVHFSSLLDLLDAQVATFHDGEQPDYSVMLDIVAYLSEYADHAHHPREDVAFARLTERDPSLRVPINRLLQEHRVIKVAGEELVEHLEDVRADAMVQRSTVEAAAAQYLAYYRHHLATEEREILPRAQRLLTAQDWAQVAEAVRAVPDPLFGDHPSEDYRELRQLLAERARVTAAGRKADDGA